MASGFVPFYRKDGVAASYGFGGGGKLTKPFRDAMGLDELAKKSKHNVNSATEWAHMMRNKRRANGVMGKIADNMTGTHGELYGAYVRSLLIRSQNALDGEELSGVTYDAYRALKGGGREADRVGKDIHKSTEDAFSRISRMLLPSGEDAPADTLKAKFDDFVFDAQGTKAVANGDPAVRDAMDEETQRAFDAAVMWHNYFSKLREDLNEAGLSVDEISDYIARIATEEEALRIKRMKPVKASQGATAAPGGQDPQKMRKQYIEALFGDDGTVDFRHLTPREINAKAGREVFESDPMVILARYGDAGRRLAQQKRFANFIAESGITVQGDSVYKQLLNRRAVQETGEAFEGSLRTLGDADARYGDQLDDIDVDRLSRQESARMHSELADELGMDASEFEAAAREAEKVRRAEKLPTARAEHTGDVDQLIANERYFINQTKQLMGFGLMDDVPYARAKQAISDATARIKLLRETPFGKEVVEKQSQARTAKIAAEGAQGEADAAENALVGLDQEIGDFVLDRDNIRKALVAALEVEDPAKQYQHIDDLMVTLQTFYQRNLDNVSDKASAARVRAERSGTKADEKVADELDEARQAYRKAMRETQTKLGDAKTGKEQVGKLTEFYRSPDETLQPRLVGMGETINTRAKQAPANMPPELDERYAPEAISKAVRKYYEVGQGPSEGLQKFIDEVYKPYFQWFKAYATIGRGPGYHIRNSIGGAWNNWLMDVTAKDHMLSWTMQSSRRTAWSNALHEEALALSEQTGRSEKWALKHVTTSEVAERAEEALRKKLEPIRVEGSDLNLYEIHLLSRENEVGSQSRVMEGMHGLLNRQRQTDPSQAADPTIGKASKRFGESQDAPVNMWNKTRGGRLGEKPLNKVQKATNWSLDNWYMDFSKRFSAGTEDWLRDAAFIQGVKRYGVADGGRSAKMIAVAAQFDYADLSDVESDWLRGAILPFYVWTRNNVPLQFRALMKSPGKFHRLLMANDAARDALGDDEHEVIPEWIRERAGFATQFSVGGNPLTLGIESPAMDLNEMLPASLKPKDWLRPIMSAIGPQFKVPAELATGNDFFTGASLEGGVEAPAWYRELAERTPLPLDEGADGTQDMPRWMSKLYTDLFPPLGQVERLVPGVNSRYQERYLSNWLSQGAALPVSTLEPDQVAGEIRSRNEDLSSMVEWSGISDEDKEFARKLLGQGYPPEAVHKVMQNMGKL